MKKTLLIILIIVAILSLNSCGQGSGFYRDEEKTGKAMEEILTQLLVSIQNNDIETFKTFFSDDIVELPDFEKGFKYVFDQYRGEMLNIKCYYPMGTGKHIVPGEQICYAFTTFNINTSENDYTIYVRFYTKYESRYPDGQLKITKLKLLNKQQLDAGENFNDCTQRYGIYYPGWISEKVE